MKDREDELFEAELRRLKPARLPTGLQARFDGLRPMASQSMSALPAAPMLPFLDRWRWFVRWVMPAVATAALVLLAVGSLRHLGRSSSRTTASTKPTLTVDQVEIDRQLLGSFDAVAEMPDGEAVRFQFQEWIDAVTLKDSARGVEVVERRPRLEVLPVRFISY